MLGHPRRLRKRNLYNGRVFIKYLNVCDYKMHLFHYFYNFQKLAKKVQNRLLLIATSLVTKYQANCGFRIRLSNGCLWVWSFKTKFKAFWHCEITIWWEIKGWKIQHKWASETSCKLSRQIRLSCRTCHTGLGRRSLPGPLKPVAHAWALRWQQSHLPVFSVVFFFFLPPDSKLFILYWGIVD